MFVYVCMYTYRFAKIIICTVLLFAVRTVSGANRAVRTVSVFRGVRNAYIGLLANKHTSNMLRTISSKSNGWVADGPCLQKNLKKLVKMELRLPHAAPLDAAVDSWASHCGSARRSCLRHHSSESSDSEGSSDPLIVLTVRELLNHDGCRPHIIRFSSARRSCLRCTGLRLRWRWRRR